MHADTRNNHIGMIIIRIWEFIVHVLNFSLLVRELGVTWNWLGFYAPVQVISLEYFTIIKEKSS